MQFDIRCWVLTIAAVAGAAIAPIDASAQFSGSAAATAKYENNSNIFSVAAGSPEATANGSPPSDTSYNYGANGAADYHWGLQSLHFSAGANKYEYQRFTQLDNTSYNFDAGLAWKRSDALDGSLDVTRSRSMVPFQNLQPTDTALSVQTAQQEDAKVGFLVTSLWRVEGSVHTSKTEQPVQGAPDLQLTETGERAALKYLGVAGFTSGFSLDYSTGSYSGTQLGTGYRQASGALTATYQSGRTGFNGQVGYSSRSSTFGGNDASGLTGAFGLNYKLTPKTTLSANISRGINNYIANTGSEIDTTLQGSVNWQARFNLGLSLGYAYTKSDFPNQGTGVATGRTDHGSYPTASATYQPFRWLVIAPYANYAKRVSSLSGGTYSSTVFGVSASARWSNTG